MHPTLAHVPPTLFPSIKATRAPSSTACIAALKPPNPAPTTARSKCSMAQALTITVDFDESDQQHPLPLTRSLIAHTRASRRISSVLQDVFRWPARDAASTAPRGRSARASPRQRKPYVATNSSLLMWSYAAFISMWVFHWSGTPASGKIAETGHTDSQAPQSMHSSGLMYSLVSSCSSSTFGWMQSTGHTSTQERSFTLIHGSVMT